MRYNISFSAEFQDMLVADLVLSLAFESIFIFGNIAAAMQNILAFLYYFPMFFIAITLVFVLHEYMHKVTAQRFGAIAAFRRSDIGLIITFFSSLIGFLIGLPGATMIYSSSFTKKEEGYVSLAGPLTNFAVFLIFFALGALIFPNFIGNVLFGNLLRTFANFSHLSYLYDTIIVTMFIALLLAFYNMLPIFPLDGSKVLRWDKRVYAASMVALFAIMALVIGIGALFGSLIFFMIFAFVLSLFYRGLFRF